MQIVYNSKTDLLYIRFVEEIQEVENQKVSDGIVLDIGKNGKIVGIEILDASNSIDLSTILPIHIEQIAWMGLSMRLCSVCSRTVDQNYSPKFIIDKNLFGYN